MIFLLDMNMARQLGKLLEAQGHTWRHVADIGLLKADDSVVLGTAPALEAGALVILEDSAIRIRRLPIG